MDKRSEVRRKVEARKSIINSIKRLSEGLGVELNLDDILEVKASHRRHQELFQLEAIAKTMEQLRLKPQLELTTEDFQKIEGVGPKTAERIMEVIEG